MELIKIATFHSPFTSKFGIPKQSGIVDSVNGYITFEKPFNNPDYVRGIEGFDYLWLIWGFSANKHVSTSPLVRPPLLGGNEKMGVFATRSPFRPNALGLSSVRLVKVEVSEQDGLILHIAGGDLMDGTPVYDIKPYISYADSHEDARCGFVDSHQLQLLSVEFAPHVSDMLDCETVEVLRQTLALDPRPKYQNDATKIYGMPFAGKDIRFRVENGVCHVIDVVPLNKS